MSFGMVSGLVERLVYEMGVVIVQGEWAVLGVSLGCPIVNNGAFVALLCRSV